MCTFSDVPMPVNVINLKSSSSDENHKLVYFYFNLVPKVLV